MAARPTAASLLVGLPIKEAEFLFRGPNRLTP